MIHGQALSTTVTTLNNRHSQDSRQDPLIGQRSRAESWQPPRGLVLEGRGRPVREPYVGSSPHTCG